MFPSAVSVTPVSTLQESVGSAEPSVSSAMVSSDSGSFSEAGLEHAESSRAPVATAATAALARLIFTGFLLMEGPPARLGRSRGSRVTGLTAGRSVVFATPYPVQHGPNCHYSGFIFDCYRSETGAKHSKRSGRLNGNSEETP
ncbi:hypothetical protein GCM10023216_24970 [Isoptericola chiayiensis]|uniref:Uncharacterized protein n=1 Tax=Isoptericola chiayiensis TaxID=579446 RepID=A0ABP8YL47_9MICO